MLTPNDGGLILYQAYGNLYAMTGRKAHFLEDKQIPSVGILLLLLLIDECNGNGNGNPNVNNGGVIPVARECTYEDFVKCQPLNFKGTEGVVGLTCWFEKMETVFHVSNCPPRYQVKYASCTLLDGILTWWNSYKRIAGVDASYAMMWKALMKLMTKRFQELTMFVIVVEPVRLHDAIRIANNLMDQKLKGYAIKNAENKRRFKNNPSDNRGQQQPPFKRQNFNGQNVAKAYTVGNNVERKGYARAFPYCSKCRLHHERPCTVKCGNYKRVGHMTRDCRTAIAATPQRAPVGNQMRNTCYEYGRPGHYRNECTFLFNNRCASMLFDLGADRSFVSTTFSSLLDDIQSTLDTSYAIELADGRILETNVILRGCTLGLLGHPFDIDLMHVELGSFDVIVYIDWLAKYHVVIVCEEKIICISYGDEVLIIEGDRCNSGKEKRLEDVPIVRDFLEVFLEDLPRLPPTDEKVIHQLHLNSEFHDPKKQIEIESWLEDSRIVDSLVGSDEIEYFDTFPTLEELEYHEWLLKCPKPS
ncbi:putative reverse transcriptase domain-containing protein [Tanacetum coccineum]